MGGGKIFPNTLFILIVEDKIKQPLLYSFVQFHFFFQSYPFVFSSWGKKKKSLCGFNSLYHFFKW